MKHIHLEEKDTTSVDMELSVPEQTLRDLVCITESSITALAGQMDSMSKDMKSMRDTMSFNLPAIIDRLQALIECMDSNLTKGVDKTDELIQVMKETNENLH